MATTEPEEQEVQWHASQEIELDELCSEYRKIQSEKKLHESVAKDLEKPLNVLAAKIQARMGEHKNVQTSFGYMLRWVPFQRKGYTVSAAEGERFELRSPF